MSKFAHFFQNHNIINWINYFNMLSSDLDWLSIENVLKEKLESGSNCNIIQVRFIRLLLFGQKLQQHNHLMKAWVWNPNLWEDIKYLKYSQQKLKIGQIWTMPEDDTYFCIMIELVKNFRGSFTSFWFPFFALLLTYMFNSKLSSFCFVFKDWCMILIHSIMYSIYRMSI